MRRYYDFDDVDLDRPSAAEAARDIEPECDGSGEIHFNRSWGNEPWNDDSYTCPGCPQCEPDEEGDDA